MTPNSDRIFYHVTRPPWRQGDSLLCWDRQVQDGTRSKTDWEHPKLQEGTDGHLICLHDNLSNARYWLLHNGLDEHGTIVRVHIPVDELGQLHLNNEEWWCYPDEIPAAWLEVVDKHETERPPNL